MAIEEIRITRDKLAEFVPDHDTIIQLERLIRIVNLLEMDGTETLEEIITRVHNSLP